MSHSHICLGESACRSSLTNKVWTIERDLCIQYLFVSFPDQSLEWFHYLLPIHLQKCFPGYWMSIKSYFPSYRELTDLIKRKYNRASILFCAPYCPLDYCPHSWLNICTHQVSEAETSFHPWKHSEKCLKDVMDLLNVYFRSLFYSEGISGQLLREVWYILLLFPKSEKGNGGYKIGCGRTHFYPEKNY